MASALLGGKERSRCPACGFVLWRNPAPVGMALIEHEGKLVLIRRNEAPLADYWAPPAGYVECGESVPAAVCREAQEECGLEIELDGLLGVWSQADVDVLIVAYAAHSCGGPCAPATMPAMRACSTPWNCRAAAANRWHRDRPLVLRRRRRNDFTLARGTSPRPEPEEKHTMIGNITPTLPEKLVGYLRPGAPALLLTSGADGYSTSAYTWALALDDKRLRFAVDVGGSSMANLQRTGLASVQVIGPGDVSFLVKGKSRLVKERIDASAPYSIMLWEMDVMGAKDQSWTGVSTTALMYEWPAQQREAMLKMEQAVYAEMRNVAG
jgi:ADP-ribose pyrophosphatase YjhB (NUDIX family)